jgi:hypothetical protein
LITKGSGSISNVVNDTVPANLMSQFFSWWNITLRKARKIHFLCSISVNKRLNSFGFTSSNIPVSPSTTFEKQIEPLKKRRRIGRPRVSYSASSRKRDKVNQALNFILNIAGSPEEARQLTQKVLDKLVSEPTNLQPNFQQLLKNIQFLFEQLPSHDGVAQAALSRRNQIPKEQLIQLTFFKRKFIRQKVCPVETSWLVEWTKEHTFVRSGTTGPLIVLDV